MFVRYVNRGDEASAAGFLYSFDADDDSFGGDPNDDIVRPDDQGGDFTHTVGVILPGSEGEGAWVGDSDREYGGFRHEGEVHLVMGGAPDLVYVGRVLVDAYVGETLTVEEAAPEIRVGTAIDIPLTAVPSAERWSASSENLSWLSVTSEGRVQGTPTSSGMFTARGFAHRRGHPPGDAVLRLSVTDE